MFSTDDVSKFSADFGKVAKFAPARSTLPVLGFVLVDVNKDGTYLSATDLEQTILIRLEDVDAGEPGGICLPAKTAASLFSMWDDPVLCVELQKRTMKATVTSGEASKSKAELKGIDPEEFPPYRSMLKGDFKPEIAYTVNTDEFKAAIERVAICASTDESRPILTAVHVVQKDDQLILEAADGFRLGRDAIAATPSNGKVSRVFEANIPAKAMIESSRLMESETILIGFDGDDGVRQVRFVSGNVEISTVTVEGNYPDVDQIIPKRTPIVATFQTRPFVAATKRAKVVASDTPIMRLSLDFEPKTATIRTQSEELGNQTEVLDLLGIDTNAEAEGTSIDIGFNLNFIGQIIGSLSGDSFTATLSAPTHPALFTSEKNPHWLSVVMPMQLL